MSLNERDHSKQEREKFVGGKDGSLTREWKGTFYFILFCVYDILHDITLWSPTMWFQNL